MQPWSHFRCELLLDIEVGSNMNCFGVATRTELDLDFLIYLDTLSRLLSHAIHKSWSYAWVSSPNK